MTLKIEGALFMDGAKGIIRRTGTYYTRKGQTYLSVKPGNEKASVNSRQAMKDCYAVAIKLHAQIVPTPEEVSGEIRMIKMPRWPEYWATYLSQNPQCML